MEAFPSNFTTRFEIADFLQMSGVEAGGRQEPFLLAECISNSDQDRRAANLGAGLCACYGPWSLPMPVPRPVRI